MYAPYKDLEDYTLKSLINRSFKLYRNNPAFGYVGKECFLYMDFQDKIFQTIQLLTSNGIEKGDRVILLSENMPHWSVAYFATTYFGAVIVPVLPDFHPSDVHHIVKHSGAKAVFVSKKHLQTIEECEDSNIHMVINLEDLAIIDELTNMDYITQIKQKAKELTQKISHAKYKLSTPKEDDLAALLYTSGTTGHSKGVMLSHKNIVTNALSGYKHIKITSDDVFLSILPLAHTLECTVGMIIPILHGASVYYIKKAPTPSVLLKALSSVKPTMMVSVPLIIEKIYKNKILSKINSSFIVRNLYKISFIRKQINKTAGKKLIETFGGRLRFFGIGGAKLSSFVEQFLLEASFPYVIGYGLTETAPLIAGTLLNKPMKIGSTGVAMVGVEIKIKNPNKDGEGEIAVKSPSVMMGYYKDEAKTAQVMEDGWFLTGDLGYIDEDGYLFISGRSKNIIIGSGGENIYPEQIEAIINQDESVLDSLVLQQNDQLIARVHLDYELLGDRFKAQKTPDSEVKKAIENHLEDLRKNVNSKVASYCKIVRFIEQIEPFVKTPTKKIKRYLYT